MLIILNFHDVHRVEKLQFLEKSTTHFNWLVYEIDWENTPSPSLWNLSKNSTVPPPQLQDLPYNYLWESADR